MKKIAVLSLMFVMMTITSCKKYLDIQPQQTFGSNLAVSTLQGLQTTVIGGFHILESANLYGGGIIYNSELMADFINPSSNVLTSFSSSQLYTHQFNAYNSNAGGMWGDGYQAILTANTVLQYLPNFQSQDPTTCNMLRGESLFIRAAMHFELCRMFAQPYGYTANNSHLGVPIILSPGTTTAEQNIPRSTVAQVYAQVISDLKTADSLLPADPAALGPEYVSKYGAEAFLARVYFMENDFNDAYTYTSKVINASPGFSLNDSATNSFSIYAIYNQLGTETTPEDVFQIINVITYDPSSGTLHSNFSTAPFGSTVPGFAMNAPFASILASAKAQGDLRYTDLYKFSFGEYFCSKYSALYSNVPVVRLAEMYLTRAECEAQSSCQYYSESAARADYNMTRVRANLAPDNSTSGTALISAIRAERDLELAMEGDHFFEVKRRQGSFNTPGAGVLQWNAPTMIFPIPQQEIQENKAMVQNPGY